MSDVNPRQPGPDDPRRCSARKSNGDPCSRWAIRGGNVCTAHGGASPNAKAGAKKRLERAAAEKAVATYGLAVDVEPLAALLQELHRTAGHVVWLGALIADLDHDVNDEGRLHSGLKQYSLESGERPSVWVELYQKERAHLARVATDCLKAGVEERKVRLAEDQAEMLAQAFRGFAVELGHDPADPAVRTAFRRHLALVRGDETAA